MESSQDTRREHRGDRAGRPERELERREARLDALGHELRNQLMVAKGRLALAREERDDEHLAAAARSHERMEALLDDLFDEGTDSPVGESGP